MGELKRCAVLLLLLTAGCGDDDGSDGGAAGGGGSGATVGGAGATSVSGQGGGGSSIGGSTSGGAGGSASGASAGGTTSGGTTSGGTTSGGTTSGGSSGAGGSAMAGGGTGGQPADAALSAQIDGVGYGFSIASFRPQPANSGTYDIVGEQGGTSLLSLEISIQASGPGSYECGNTSLTFYDQGGKAFHAVASDGECSIEVSAWPAAEGDYFDATFTATLVRTGEAPKSLTQGVAHVRY
jgi:hypothetical protein